MEVRTIHYPLWHTSVQISAFIPRQGVAEYMADRKSTRLNSSHT